MVRWRTKTHYINENSSLFLASSSSGAPERLYIVIVGRGGVECDNNIVEVLTKREVASSKIAPKRLELLFGETRQGVERNDMRSFDEILLLVTEELR